MPKRTKRPKETSAYVRDYLRDRLKQFLLKLSRALQEVITVSSGRLPSLGTIIGFLFTGAAAEAKFWLNNLINEKWGFLDFFGFLCDHYWDISQDDLDDLAATAKEALDKAGDINQGLKDDFRKFFDLLSGSPDDQESLYQLALWLRGKIEEICAWLRDTKFEGGESVVLEFFDRLVQIGEPLRKRWEALPPLKGEPPSAIPRPVPIPAQSPQPGRGSSLWPGNRSYLVPLLAVSLIVAFPMGFLVGQMFVPPYPTSILVQTERITKVVTQNTTVLSTIQTLKVNTSIGPQQAADVKWTTFLVSNGIIFGRLTNIGSAPATNFTITIVLNGPNGFQGTDNIPVAYLGPSQTIEFTDQIPQGLPQGAYLVTATANCDCGINRTVTTIFQITYTSTFTATTTH